MNRWSALPQAMRRHVRLDNIAIVPASLLPDKARYQAFANRLPHGAVLIVLPTGESAPTTVLRSIAARFETTGHRVTLVPAARLHGPCVGDHDPDLCPFG